MPPGSRTVQRVCCMWQGGHTLVYQRLRLICNTLTRSPSCHPLPTWRQGALQGCTQAALAEAHSRPPCTSRSVRLIDSPVLPGLVVQRVSKSRSILSGSSLRPESYTAELQDAKMCRFRSYFCSSF